MNNYKRFVVIVKTDHRSQKNLPVYSAMEVMEEAVEPLSQSLSAARLFRLPGNDSTESQLDTMAHEWVDQ